MCCCRVALRWLWYNWMPFNTLEYCSFLLPEIIMNSDEHTRKVIKKMQYFQISYSNNKEKRISVNVFILQVQSVMLFRPLHVSPEMKNNCDTETKPGWMIKSITKTLFWDIYKLLFGGFVWFFIFLFFHMRMGSSSSRSGRQQNSLILWYDSNDT